MAQIKEPRNKKATLKYPAEARTPAVKRRESPGKKKPKKSPDSAKTNKKMPINPIVCINGMISKMCIVVCGVRARSYLARVPAGISSFGSRRENLPSSVEIAKIIP